MIKKILFLASLAVLASCSGTQQTDDIQMLVGTYTSGTSCGIYSLDFNQSTGKATFIDSTEVKNPSYLTFSPDKKVVYAVTENNDTTAAVSAYSFNKADGSLTFVNSQLTHGEDPCYVATNGRLLLTANYSGGSISAFGLKRDGSIEHLDTLLCGSIGGPDMTRQETAHIHCTLLTPDGRYILASDFSADRILTIPLNPTTGMPEAIREAASVNADTGPRHIVMSADGRFVYVIGELAETVSVFSYDDGHLELLQTIATHGRGDRHAADLHISPDGRFLYASVRNIDDGLAIFSIDAATGQLAKVGFQPTGKHPRNFNITPNGRYVLVACMNGGVIEVYERDLDTGLLVNTHNDIPVDQPTCIVFR